MPEWLRRLSPTYASRRSDVELLALAIANNMTMQRLAAIIGRCSAVLQGTSLAQQQSYCELTYELPLKGHGKVRNWEVQMLSNRVGEILSQRKEIGMNGYRFVYDEPNRAMSFYAQCKWGTS